MHCIQQSSENIKHNWFQPILINVLLQFIVCSIFNCNLNHNQFFQSSISQDKIMSIVVISLTLHLTTTNLYNSSMKRNFITRKQNVYATISTIQGPTSHFTYQTYINYIILSRCKFETFKKLQHVNPTIKTILLLGNCGPISFHHLVI